MLRAGTETGSLINHLYSRYKTPDPTIGMGATILCWTDRHAGTIIKVTPKQVHVQRDNAKRADTNGMSESQDWTYTPNPEGVIDVFRLTKKGYRHSRTCVHGQEADAFHEALGTDFHIHAGGCVMQTLEQYQKALAATGYVATICDCCGCSSIASHKIQIDDVPHGLVPFHVCATHYDRWHMKTWQEFHPHVKAYNAFKG